MPSTTYAPIGTMGERIIVQQATPSDDGMGGTSVSWTTLLTTWASVLPLTLTERERLASLQVTALQSYRIVTRYRSTWNTALRLVWRGKTLQIHTITDDVSGKRRSVLECTEIQ